MSAPDANALAAKAIIEAFQSQGLGPMPEPSAVEARITKLQVFPREFRPSLALSRKLAGTVKQCELHGLSFKLLSEALQHVVALCVLPESCFKDARSCRWLLLTVRSTGTKSCYRR